MPNINTFSAPQDVATTFASDFSNWFSGLPSNQTKVTVALSGGNTPKLLYQVWASQYATAIDWNRIHFFWGDERCVAPDDADSNYGTAKTLFFDKISIDPANIHCVHGECDPDEERSRYENEIYEHVEIDDNAIPQFDFVILGMGADGHTASIFPHQMQFLKSDKVCEVAIHPETAQKRITLTGPVLNGAHRVAFLVTGSEKAAVLRDVINQSGDFESFPASHITGKQVDFYVDSAAANAI